ncbi:MAG: DnaA/Hda family protein [Pseudomonadota bacterium]
MTTGRSPVQSSFDFTGPPVRFDTIAVTSSNRSAVALLRDAESWPFPAVCLVGPPKSGRTTLARCWALEHGAALLAPSDLSGLGESACRELAAGAVAFDPGDVLADETELLELLNLAAESSGRILFTATAPPSVWQVDNRDLASRLVSMPLAELFAPDEDMISARLEAGLSRHAADLPGDVARFLVRRLKRSYEDIEECVKRLSGESVGGSGLTRGVARRALEGMYGPPEEDDG